MIEHIVVCRLRRDHDPGDYAAVIAGLAALVARLPGARRFAAGPNRDVERRSAGFDAGFVIAFDDLAALAAYAGHPDHRALAARLVALCDGGVAGVMVFDLDCPS
jgi:antibiotic biosynthesis monooxygenase (ABM) superfamily enzyme